MGAHDVGAMSSHAFLMDCPFDVFPCSDHHLARLWIFVGN